MKLNYLQRGQAHAVELQQEGDSFNAVVDRKSYSVKLIKLSDSDLTITINGQTQQTRWAKKGRDIWIHWDGQSYQLVKAAGRGVSSGSAAGLENVLRAPMPGQVRKVMAEEGQNVKAGETLLLLEAMKMEIRIQAAHDAKVARVAVKQGQTVEKEQILVELKLDQ